MTRDVSSKEPVHCRWHAVAGRFKLGAPSNSQSGRVGIAVVRVHGVWYMDG